MLTQILLILPQYKKYRVENSILNVVLLYWKNLYWLYLR